MAWKEDKKKSEWVEKDFKVAKRPLNEHKDIFHVYYKEQYIAYCNTLIEGQEFTKNYKVPK